MTPNAKTPNADWGKSAFGFRASREGLPLAQAFNQIRDHIPDIIEPRQGAFLSVCAKLLPETDGNFPEGQVLSNFPASPEFFKINDIPHSSVSLVSESRSSETGTGENHSDGSIYHDGAR